MSEREERAIILAADLVDDRTVLLDRALVLIDELDRAVLAGDLAAATLAADRYEAVIYKMNGGSFFGCAAGPQAPANLVETHCQAVPGNVPKWGQSGAFLIHVGQVRARVVVRNYSGGMSPHYAFHAVDLDRPFISETGFRSHFDSVMEGHRVDEAATEIFASYLSDNRKALSLASRKQLSREPLPSWLASITPPPCRQPISVPPGFELVSAVLPAHRAFVVRKWALAVQKQVKNQREILEIQTDLQPDNVPPGFELVSAVLPAHRAFIVRSWTASDCQQLKHPEILHDEACHASMPISATFKPFGYNARDEAPFRPGQRCVIVQVHHPVFAAEVGKIVIINRVFPDTGHVYAHDDAPTRYRVNRRGNQVVDFEPKNILTIYSYDQLRLCPQEGVTE